MTFASTTFGEQCAKRVSYILATRNHADKLEKCLQAMRSLKEPEDELIVIDGASTDHTREVVRRFADLIDIFISEPDVHPVFSSMGLDGKPIQDPIHAVNKGMLLANGRYIKTIADDDIYHPEGIRKAIAVLETHPEIDLLLCGGTRERFGRVEYVYVPPGVNYGKSAEDVFRYGKGCGVGHFFRTSALTRVGLHPYYRVRPDGEFIVNADAEYVLKFIAMGAIVRFCRTNAFHSPYSHYDYPSRGIVEKPENYWLRAVRSYCSRRFYVKYRIARKIRQSVFYGKFRALQKWIRLRVHNSTLKRLLGKRRAVEYIWDGGLS